MTSALGLFTIGLLVHLCKYCLAQEPPEGYYRSRYDHINIDTVMNSKRLVTYYAACLLSKGPCPPQGAELKRVLPEALQTNCARCTEKQKAGAFRTIKRLRKEYPGIWKALLEEYDPTEKYVRRFEETMLSKKSYLPSPPVSFTTSKVDFNAPPSQTPQLLNKFPVIDSSSTTSTPSTQYASFSTSDTSTSSTASTTAFSTTTHTAKPSPSTTTTRYTTSTTKKIETKKPVTTKPTKTTTNILEPLPIFIPAMFPDVPNKGVTTNTVSLLPGVRLQVDTPNWLSSLGNRVIQTGSRIGKAVVSTVQAVVGR
uniref:Chemosensory protein n=1 Tax=Agrilus zanthoxylumi TaxID=2696312 RepID=A0A8A6LP18_9COLE|nr:chemosensory protein [Agrilus zanthoxylumi]